MKMFNLINIGERAGSGVPNIFNTWEEEGWKEPIIEERFDPDRTILTLEFIEKQAIKTGDNIQKVREFLEKNGESKTSDIADYIDLSPARTRAILSTMDDVEPIGENRNRKYKLKEYAVCMRNVIRIICIPSGQIRSYTGKETAEKYAAGVWLRKTAGI